MANGNTPFNFNFKLPGNMFSSPNEEDDDLPQDTTPNYADIVSRANESTASAQEELNQFGESAEGVPDLNIETTPMMDTEPQPSPGQPQPTEQPGFDLPGTAAEEPLAPVGGPQVMPGTNGQGGQPAIDIGDFVPEAGPGAGGYNYEFNQPTIGTILSNLQNRDDVDLGAPQGITPATIGSPEVAGQAAQITGAAVPTAATIGDTGPAFQGADIGGVGGITAAQIAEGTGDAGALAQQQQIDALTAMAQGEVSPVVEQQRERGIQNVLAMMATQRGVPASALIRTGMQGIAEVNRQAQEAASQQQLQALSALGQAGTQARQQDIALGTQQAQFEQQARQQTAEMKKDVALQQAGFEQQAGLQASEQAQQTAVKQAEFTQRASEMAAQIKTSTAVEQAQLEQQIEVQRVNLEQQRLSQEAAFQQEAGITDAQMEQARTIAEAQVNQQIEASRNSLTAALVDQGVNVYLAEQRVNQEMEQLREELTYRYWAAREGAIVEVGKFLMDQAWFWETPTDQLFDELGALDYLLGQQIPGFAASDIGQSPLAPPVINIIEGTGAAEPTPAEEMADRPGVRSGLAG